MLWFFLTGLEDEFNEDSDSDFNFDEGAIITFYYNRGLEYNEILGFLAKYHNHCISYSTLLRRLKQYGLSRKSRPNLVPRVSRARRDPGRVWSRASVTIENTREGSSLNKKFVALSFVEFKARLIASRCDSAITRDGLQ